jgi:hypothetical protein
MRLERRPVARRLTVEPIGRYCLDGRGERLNRCGQVLRHRGSNRMRAVSVMIEHAANGIELAMPSQKEENQVIVCSNTMAGLRDNLYVAVAYTAVWLSGNGAVAIHNLMEDARHRRDLQSPGVAADQERHGAGRHGREGDQRSGSRGPLTRR